jgi:hypothetical protein
MELDTKTKPLWMLITMSILLWEGRYLGNYAIHKKEPKSFFNIDKDGLAKTLSKPVESVCRVL